MPPILIYRAATKDVEEFVMKGMPLGAFENFRYQKIETELNPGDTVLLQSDGFAEQFNPSGKSFGELKGAELFREIAEQQPEKIADRLFAEVAAWRGDRQQDDDITFIVFRKQA
jgi:sigma-B regulation protein RsbU (phosphoserine phosphatase)